MMIPALMSSQTGPNLPLSPVMVNTNNPSMACANNMRSRKGYARPTNRVAGFIADALAPTDSNKGGIMPTLVGKIKIDAVASTFVDITDLKRLMYVKMAKNRKPYPTSL